MKTTKRKISISVDADVLDELAGNGEALSTLINEILREEAQRRRQQRLLGEFLDELDAKYGPPDPKLVEHYQKLLRDPSSARR